MPSNRRARPRLYALLVALCVVTPISILAALPWLKQQPDALVFLLTGTASALVIAAAFALAIVQDRKMDEWQRSNSRFSSQWGMAAGAGLVGLLLALPEFRDLIVSGAAIWGGEANPDHRLVVTTFTFGFMAAIAAQGMCTALLSIGWVWWKSRAPREAS
jgi:hypothetical protein